MGDPIPNFLHRSSKTSRSGIFADLGITSSSDFAALNNQAVSSVGASDDVETFMSAIKKPSMASMVKLNATTTRMITETPSLNVSSHSPSINSTLIHRKTIDDDPVKGHRRPTSVLETKLSPTATARTDSLSYFMPSSNKDVRISTLKRQLSDLDNRIYNSSAAPDLASAELRAGKKVYELTTMARSSSGGISSSGFFSPVQSHSSLMGNQLISPNLSQFSSIAPTDHFSDIGIIGDVLPARSSETKMSTFSALNIVRGTSLNVNTTRADIARFEATIQKLGLFTYRHRVISFIRRWVVQNRFRVKDKIKQRKEKAIKDKELVNAVILSFAIRRRYRRYLASVKRQINPLEITESERLQSIRLSMLDRRLESTIQAMNEEVLASPSVKSLGSLTFSFLRDTTIDETKDVVAEEKELQASLFACDAASKAGLNLQSGELSGLGNLDASSSSLGRSIVPKSNPSFMVSSRKNTSKALGLHSPWASGMVGPSIASLYGHRGGSEKEAKPTESTKRPLFAFSEGDSSTTSTAPESPLDSKDGITPGESLLLHSIVETHLIPAAKKSVASSLPAKSELVPKPNATIDVSAGAFKPVRSSNSSNSNSSCSSPVPPPSVVHSGRPHFTLADNVAAMYLYGTPASSAPSLSTSSAAFSSLYDPAPSKLSAIAGEAAPSTSTFKQLQDMFDFESPLPVSTAFSAAASGVKPQGSGVNISTSINTLINNNDNNNNVEANVHSVSQLTSQPVDSSTLLKPASTAATLSKSHSFFRPPESDMSIQEQREFGCIKQQNLLFTHRPVLAAVKEEPAPHVPTPFERVLEEHRVHEREQREIELQLLRGIDPKDRYTGRASLHDDIPSNSIDSTTIQPADDDPLSQTFQVDVRAVASSLLTSRDTFSTSTSPFLATGRPRGASTADTLILRDVPPPDLDQAVSQAPSGTPQSSSHPAASCTSKSTDCLGRLPDYIRAGPKLPAFDPVAARSFSVSASVQRSLSPSAAASGTSRESENAAEGEEQTRTAVGLAALASRSASTGVPLPLAEASSSLGFQLGPRGLSEAQRALQRLQQTPLSVEELVLMGGNMPISSRIQMAFNDDIPHVDEGDSELDEWDGSEIESLALSADDSSLSRRDSLVPDNPFDSNLNENVSGLKENPESPSLLLQDAADVTGKGGKKVAVRGPLMAKLHELSADPHVQKEKETEKRKRAIVSSTAATDKAKGKGILKSPPSTAITAVSTPTELPRKKPVLRSHQFLLQQLQTASDETTVGPVLAQMMKFEEAAAQKNISATSLASPSIINSSASPLAQSGNSTNPKVSLSPSHSAVEGASNRRVFDNISDVQQLSVQLQSRLRLVVPQGQLSSPSATSALSRGRMSEGLLSSHVSSLSGSPASVQQGNTNSMDPTSEQPPSSASREDDLISAAITAACKDKTQLANVFSYSAGFFSPSSINALALAQPSSVGATIRLDDAASVITSPSHSMTTAAPVGAFHPGSSALLLPPVLRSEGFSNCALDELDSLRNFSPLSRNTSAFVSGMGDELLATPESSRVDTERGVTLSRLFADDESTRASFINEIKLNASLLDLSLLSTKPSTSARPADHRAPTSSNSQNSARSSESPGGHHSENPLDDSHFKLEQLKNVAKLKAKAFSSMLEKEIDL